MATNDKYELNVEGTEETGELNLTDETSRSLGLDVESSTENCVGLTMEDGTSNYLSLNLEDTILRSASEEGEEAREKAEAERRKNEVARISAEKTREDAEAIRVANEKKRVSAESARVTAETSRATAETARVSAEKKRETAETTRTTQETARVTAEAKRVAEWEEIKKTISGVKFYVCKTGEYDATTKVPTLTGASGIIYLTPVSDATETQNYTEWLYVEDTKKFEKIGSSEVSVTPISTSTIDAIANGESKTGNEVATTTGLTYIFAKLKALFAPLTHTHKKADITDFDHTHKKADITDLTLGEADLTITQDSTTLGTFGANATTAKTIDIPSPTLTITQGGTTKGTYKPSSKTNTTIDLAQGTAFYICKSGEYDTTTLTPTLTGNSNTIYFVPLPTDAKGKSDNNSYAEFVYLESSKKFESICISPTAGSSDVNDGVLSIYLTHGTETSYRQSVFTANQATNTSVSICSVPSPINVTYGSYIMKDEGIKYNWAEPSTSISSTSTNLVTGNTVNSHLVKNYAPKTHTHVSNDVTDLGKGTLTIKANDEVKGTFGANATEDVTIDLGASGEVNDGVLTVKQGEATLGTFSANQKDASTITVPEPNNATLTIKAGETTKGIFTANAKDDVTIDIGEAIVNDGALTVKQGDTILATFKANQAEDETITLDKVNDATLTIKREGEILQKFSANADTDTEVDIKHKTGSGYNHIPTGGELDNYLSWSADGTAKWDATNNIVKDYAKLASPTFTGTPAAPTASAGTSTTQIATTKFVTDADTALLKNTALTGTPTAPTATAKTATTQIATTKFVTDADTALLKDTALTGTPTAPTATVGTNTTQIATTAYVLKALEPVTVLNGTNTNYISAYSNRASIVNILLVKTGNYYSMDLKFTLNSNAKASYASSEWWNVFSIGSTLKTLVNGNPFYGVVNDTATSGNMSGLITQAPSNSILEVSFPSTLTVSNDTIWHALLSFIGKP